MRRLQAAAALVFTAFFAVYGAFHHHIPRATHDHPGLCSEYSAGSGLESCAICKATHTAAERLVAVDVAGGSDRSSSLSVTPALAPFPTDVSLVHGCRAPPAA